MKVCQSRRRPTKWLAATRNRGDTSEVAPRRFKGSFAAPIVRFGVFRTRNLSSSGRPRSGRGGFRGVNKDNFGSKNKASQNK